MNFPHLKGKVRLQKKYQENKVKAQDGADDQLLTALRDPADAAKEQKQQARG